MTEVSRTLVLTNYFAGDVSMTAFTTLKKLIAWRQGPKPVAQIDDEEEESDGMKILKQIIAEHKAKPLNVLSTKTGMAV